MRFRLQMFVLCTFMQALDAGAVDVNEYMSGSWYNPDQEGHGFSVEVVSEDVSVFYWYVYNPDGTPTFLMGVGNNVGDTIHAVAYHNRGMHWGEFDSGHRTEMVWGTLDITFNDCNSATLSYSSSHHMPGIPSGQGQIPLTRLLSMAQMQCADNVYAGIYHGALVSWDIWDQGLYPGTIVLTPDDRIYAFSHSGDVMFGTYSISGGQIHVEGTAFWEDESLDEWMSQEVSLTGPIVPGHRLKFAYAVGGLDIGSADMYALHDLFQRGVRMSDISGDWHLVDIADGGGGSWGAADISISGDGSIAGTDSFGCLYAGDADIPDARFNLFEITVTVTGCEEAGGTFTGVGYQFDAPDLGDGNTLRIIVASDMGAAALQLVP